MKLKRVLNKAATANTDDERLELFEPIQDIANCVQSNNDKSSFGMGLEFGLALFCHGSR